MATGRLETTVKGSHYKFFFKKGVLVFAEKESVDMESLVISFLNKSIYIKKEVFRECEKKRVSVMRSVIELLIEDGHLSIMLYSKIISSIVRIYTIDLLSAQKGAFTFFPTEKIKEIHAVKPIDIEVFKPLAENYSTDKKSIRKVLDHLFTPIILIDTTINLKRKTVLFSELPYDRIWFF